MTQRSICTTGMSGIGEIALRHSPIVARNAALALKVVIGCLAQSF